MLMDLEKESDTVNKKNLKKELKEYVVKYLGKYLKSLYEACTVCVRESEKGKWVFGGEIGIQIGLMRLLMFIQG